MFKRIPYHPNFEINPAGDVRHIDTKEPVKPWFTGTYLAIWMTSKSPYGVNRKKRYVHRLVADTFIGKQKHGEELFWEDGDFQNCALGNLSYYNSEKDTYRTAKPAVSKASRQPAKA